MPNKLKKTIKNQSLQFLIFLFVFYLEFDA